MSDDRTHLNEKKNAFRKHAKVKMLIEKKQEQLNDRVIILNTQTLTLIVYATIFNRKKMRFQFLLIIS